MSSTSQRAVINGHYGSSLGSELRIGVEWVLAALSICAIGLYLLSETDVLSIGQDVAQRYVLVLLAAAASSLVIARWHACAGRWFALGAIVLVIHVGAVWHDSPSFLSLAPVPVLVGAALVGPLAAIAAAASEVASIALLAGVFLPRDAMSVVAPTVAVAGTLGLTMGSSGALGRISSWLEEYMEVARASLADARAKRAELEQTLSRLEQANRQLALSGQRMGLLREAAEDAQRSKSVFVANVSHEFRTPLNTIMGLVELMMNRSEIYAVALPPKMQDDLQTVHRNCMHISTMIGDVLDLTQMEKGRLELHRERVDLAEFADACVEVVRPLVERKRLTVRTRISENIPPVFCDRTRVRQVIVNLLSNAVRHTEAGGILIEARLDGEAVQISVIDTGSGITPEHVERVFEPFYQGGAAIWRETGGSGLGLSISREFVRRHGGRIWLESELGHGTAVHFTLPISAPVRPVGGPGHQIRADWLWREDAFMTQAAMARSDLVRPRVVVHDTVGALAPHLCRYDDEAEFVLVPDAAQLRAELDCAPASAVLINSESADELWPIIESLGSTAPQTPILGCSFVQPSSRSTMEDVDRYLVKPVSRAELLETIQSSGWSVRRVLVVDDDKTTLDLFTRMILSIDESIRVKTASSGALAILSLREDPADLVLLDLVMAGMDGWQLLDAIRNEVKLSGVRVVVTSAQDPEDGPPTTRFLFGSKGNGLSLDALVSCSLRLADLMARV